MSNANLFSNHSLSAQGAWHFVEAYLVNSFSGVSLTDGFPNFPITESTESPNLIALNASWRFARTYRQVAAYKHMMQTAVPTEIDSQVGRIKPHLTRRYSLKRHIWLVSLVPIIETKPTIPDTASSSPLASL